MSRTFDYRKVVDRCARKSRRARNRQVEAKPERFEESAIREEIREDSRRDSRKDSRFEKRFEKERFEERGTRS